VAAGEELAADAAVLLSGDLTAYETLIEDLEGVRVGSSGADDRAHCPSGQRAQAHQAEDHPHATHHAIDRQRVIS
jgi:hypothetical protein